MPTYLVPALFPDLTPSKRPLAHAAQLLGQIFLGHSSRHSTAVAMMARELLDPILRDNVASDKHGAMATLQLLRTAGFLLIGSVRD